MLSISLQQFVQITENYSINDTHVEELDPVQKFIGIQG